MRVSAGVCVVVPSLYCNFVPWCLESSFLSISLYWQRNVLPPQSSSGRGLAQHITSPIAHHTARTWRYVWGLPCYAAVSWFAAHRCFQLYAVLLGEKGGRRR
jgi:hypothetical protein